jgi:hypothetical protein
MKKSAIASCLSSVAKLKSWIGGFSVKGSLQHVMMETSDTVASPQYQDTLNERQERKQPSP